MTTTKKPVDVDAIARRASATGRKENGMSDTKKPVDWQAIEREVRTGEKSVRQIGRENEVSHTAIAKRAEAGGWAPPEVAGKNGHEVASLARDAQAPLDAPVAKVTEVATDTSRSAHGLDTLGKEPAPSAPAAESSPEAPKVEADNGLYGGRHFIPESAPVKELPAAADPAMRAVHIVPIVDDTGPRETGPALRPDYPRAPASLASAPDAAVAWRVMP